MNICEYKNAMSEIVVKTAGIEEMLYKKLNKNEKNKYKKWIPSYAIAVIAVFVFLFLQGLPATEPMILMTVYAADNDGIPLSNEYVNIKTNAIPLMGSSTIDTQGNYFDSMVNFNINITCEGLEGQEIQTITYTCSDKEVTRGNITSSIVYYVENITMPVEEYKNYKIQEDEKFLSGFYGEGEEIAHLTRLVGNSYTVTYAEQANKQYGIVVASTTDEKGTYHFEDFVIKAEIKLRDGSVVKKKLLVHSGEDAFTEIEIRIL
ncbi:MAG: hypothetical protein K0S01_2212 [Herbinix sp.]|jgi:hypothetical protein|nr:hypothetical protein [Herbinix sp.]